MAGCPKCGKNKIKRRNGIKKCKRCGIISDGDKTLIEKGGK